MPFGLEGGPRRYQEASDKVFAGLKCVKNFVDDFVVAGPRVTHLEDLRATFKRIHDASMGLNQEKCTFAVEKGSLLGHKVI